MIFWFYFVAVKQENYSISIMFRHLDILVISILLLENFGG